MGALEALRGKIVALDTAPFIYLMEAHPAYLPWLDPFFEFVARGEIQVITSTVTLAEVLVQPFRVGRPDLIEEYTALLLRTRNITTCQVSFEIAEESARIRAGSRFKIPDAVQLATAKVMGAQSFLTNDLALSTYKSVSILQLTQLANDL